MKRPKVIVLVGNIGSGKSTLVQKFVERGYVCICRDALRYSIGAGQYIFNHKYEPAIHNTEKAMYEQFLRLGVNIIVDETGISKRMRRPYIEIANRIDGRYQLVAIEMPRLDMKESVDRRMNNPHGQFDRILWEDVWKHFDMVYETPTKLEGFDKVIRRRK